METMMYKRFLRWLILMLMSSCAVTAKSLAEASLGQVQFPNSCAPQVQIRFLEGIALLHSFEFTEAEQAFSQVEKADPKCVIAAWGIALAKTERNGANAPQMNLAAGWTQLQPWLSIKAGTEREQMYVEAVRAMYEGYDKTSADEREQNYLTRMDEIRRKYPSDINASLFYAIGLAFNSGSGKEGLEHRREALAILFPIFEKYPQNPGAAHYIIHAADTAELASEALPAAREYAKIAPDSPHALHMPSHIFNRLGYWKESISTNQASARVAAEWINTGRDGTFDELHALNNLEYAYLQLGEKEQATETMKRIAEIAAKPGGDPWALIEAQIYFDVETHDWNDALRIQPPPNSKFTDNFEVYWIQAIAAAHLGQPVEARASLEKFRQSLSDWEKMQGQSWDAIWESVFSVALTEAESWTLFSERKHEEAIAHLKNAAPYERDHPMYYADVLPRPIGEMLGDMLSQMGKWTQALQAYQMALELAPNRLDSLVGAMTAAAKSGNVQLSEAYATKIRAEGGRIALRP
jgi:tetratricopeptide (TPR) repeat protein